MRRGRPSDQDLLARHVAGDPDAFGEIVRRHRDRLWAVALRTLGDREEAADAVQDALVSAFRAAHTFRGQSAVTTWLHRITVNACLDRARKAASRRDLARDRRPSGWSSSWSPTSPPRLPPSGRTCTASSSAALPPFPPNSAPRSSWWTCRATPSPRPPRILDVPTGTVKSRCARGRARLLPLLTHLRSERRG